MNESENKRLGELIIELAHGKCEILTDIAYRVEKILRSIGVFYYSNSADVDDAIQNLYVRLYYKAKDFRENTNACAWVIKLFENSIKSQLKKNKRDRQVLDEFVSIHAENSLFDEREIERHLFLKSIFDRLTAAEQDLIKYYFWCGFSVREVADILHKPKSTIEYQIEKLKEKIKEWEE